MKGNWGSVLQEHCKVSINVIAMTMRVHPGFLLVLGTATPGEAASVIAVQKVIETLNSNVMQFLPPALLLRNILDVCKWIFTVVFALERFLLILVIFVFPLMGMEFFAGETEFDNDGLMVESFPPEGGP